MANVIMDRFGVGYRAAECLMRTETSYVQNQTAAKSYEDAGCTDYEILTASDRRTCSRCAAQNGKRYPFTAMQPGENAPPFHPNCRCTILPVVGEEERLAKKAGPEELGFAVAKTGESGIIVPKADGVLDLETGVPISLQKAQNCKTLKFLRGKGQRKNFDRLKNMLKDTAGLLRTGSTQREKACWQRMKAT